MSLYYTTKLNETSSSFRGQLENCKLTNLQICVFKGSIISLMCINNVYVWNVQFYILEVRLDHGE